MTVDILWKKFPIKPVELSLARVLRCGQTFRWKNINNTWSFTTHDRIVLLRQDDNYIHYSWIMSDISDNKFKKITELEKETYNFIQDYFNLSINLERLYEDWIEQDRSYKKSTKCSPFDKFPGIRILRQDPWETLISFICSSNNNVKRISKMCDNLCIEYGNYINEYEGIRYYSFPAAEALSSSPNVEFKLRELGFGYRAKYIYQTACKMTNDEDYPDITLERLNALRQQGYEISHDFLLQLSGVGPKVADCICLMALDKHEIVPIDTHVYQIAIRDYKFKGSKNIKTLNKKTYSEIRVFFKEIFGKYAGWAHSVLFTSDLNNLNNGFNKVEDIVQNDSMKKEAIHDASDNLVNRITKQNQIEIDIKTENANFKRKKIL